MPGWLRLVDLVLHVNIPMFSVGLLLPFGSQKLRPRICLPDHPSSGDGNGINDDEWMILDADPKMVGMKRNQEMSRKENIN